jgi:hypothetical protein
MAVIDNETKTMRKVEDNDIERYASIAKDKSPKK